MALDVPRSFKDAVQSHESRDLLPADLRAQLSSKLPQELKQRSFFISGITQAEILQKVKDDIGQVISGKMTESEVQSKLRQTGEMLKGTVLEKDSRLKLVLSTNVDMARGYGQWKQGQNKFILAEYPAQELYRAENRKEPRDWPKRWAAPGGKFFPGKSDYPQGRMIALKNDPIWEHISAFGLPYPPFDYNSGMGVKDIDAAEATKLGLVSPVQKPKKGEPVKTTTFNRRIDLPSSPPPVVVPAKKVGSPAITPSRLPARAPVLVPMGTSASDVATQETRIGLVKEAEAQAEAESVAATGFNRTLQAHPDVTDDALLSVLQALFAEFAIMGTDEIFREIEKDQDKDNN